MTTLETQYNQVLELIEKGYSKEEALLQFSKYRNELEPLLEIGLALSALPKNEPPAPAMQRKYALAVQHSLWFALTHISRFAGISISLLLLVSAISLAGYQTSQSSPGQMLFPVKKSAEKLQLILASGENAKATLQLAITQKRLSEAQAILQNPDSKPEAETAALQELADQTSTAVEAVNSAAKNNPSPESTTPLLSSLDLIARQQESLITDIKEDSPLQASAENAIETLSKTTEKVSEIKNLVAQKLEQSTSTDPEVKGESTTTARTALETEAPTGKTATPTKNSLVVEEEKPAIVDPNTTTGSFILEDPAPQFFGN